MVKVIGVALGFTLSLTGCSDVGEESANPPIDTSTTSAPTTSTETPPAPPSTGSTGEDTAADVDADDPEPAAPTSLVSPLGFEITLPAHFVQEVGGEADEWLHSFLSEDGGFRVRAFDRPDRVIFFEVADDEPPPGLLEAARQLAQNFPEEFGTDPSIEPMVLGTTDVVVIDAATGISGEPTLTVLTSGRAAAMVYAEIRLWGPDRSTLLDLLTFDDAP